MSAPVIELRDVHKRFAAGERTITALDGLSAEVGSGRITGLVGPDGAGKTTLMRLLTGLLKPDSGSIRVLELDTVTDTQNIQASIGYMPQRFGLYEDLSVSENLELYADLQGLAGTDRKARFDRLMTFTGLGPFRKRLAGRLSGGMKQKLGLACTLVRPPRLLLLDEPSVGVDPVSRRELWDIVHSLVDEGISVLWATAYLDEAERCHDVLLLNEGRLLAAGPPQTLSERLKGRTFAVRVASADRRTVLHEIRGLPHVVDAIVKGRDVRVLVSRHADTAYLSRCCRNVGTGALQVEEVDPVFEDAFIDLLKDQDVAAETSVISVSNNAQPRNGSDPTGKPSTETVLAGTPKLDDRRNNGEAVIQVAGLVRKFGDFTAVDGIDFSVKRGEIFGLLGPNGAGKSTTFRMLCGLLPPTDGKALVLGIDLRRAAAIARGRIGYMAQKFSLYGNMSVLQNLQFFASAYGLAGRTRQRKIDVELAEFGLVPYADATSETLPLGYKQRLALACAIMHEPGVLFLDEPTSGVDPLVRREFWTRINAMAAAGVTVMVTTHFMEEAEYCDRIGIIYRGRLVAAGTPQDLKNEHRNTDLPNPTLEDAFVDLIEHYDREHPQ
ncbi:MAG: ATP-binding cassette domain-containing protein [Nitrospiraceae bacterium]|nr:ATP-binding cassette domain-containing protein [Nitrospiraceae bacterium]